MVLGWTGKVTDVMTTFFNEWEKSCDDGFGYYVMTQRKYEYMLKAPYNSVYKTRRGVRTFMLHCRMKTSGAKKGNGGEENHPYLGEDQRLLLMHNGHVTNYDKLKKFLIRIGHKFQSEVDSEVLLHSLEYILGDRQISEDVIKEWIRFLNKWSIAGTINTIVLDRLTMKWFAYSDGSIEVMKMLASDDLFIGSSATPLSSIPVFTFSLRTGYAIFGIKNRILSVSDAGKLAQSFGSWGYTENGLWSGVVRKAKGAIREIWHNGSAYIGDW